MERREIGFQMKAVSNLIMRRIDVIKAGSETEGLTGMQGWIIGYVRHNRDRDVFQRDVEAEFNIRRSTATGILQLMERNGLITRTSVPYDARLKKLTLTPKAESIHKRIMQELREMEELINRGITDEERECFFGVVEKIKANLA